MPLTAEPSSDRATVTSVVGAASSTSAVTVTVVLEVSSSPMLLSLTLRSMSVDVSSSSSMVIVTGFTVVNPDTVAPSTIVSPVPSSMRSSVVETVRFRLPLASLGAIRIVVLLSAVKSVPLVAVEAPSPVVTNASVTFTAVDLSVVLRVAMIRNVAESPSSTLSSSPSPTRVELSEISGSSSSARVMVAPSTV